MGPFFQKFAARILSGPARPPLLAVSIFGKHPGWDDHMEDVGHQFPDMLAFKRMIYVEGIGGNIDSGSWAHLPDAQRLAEFNHLLIYSFEDYYILASIAASRDGKGRSLYPLITAVEARGYSLADIVEHVGPLILKLRDNVLATSSATAVQSAVQAAQKSLDQLTGILQPHAIKADRLVTGSQMLQVLTAENAPPRGYRSYCLQFAKSGSKLRTRRYQWSHRNRALTDVWQYSLAFRPNLDSIAAWRHWLRLSPDGL